MAGGFGEQDAHEAADHRLLDGVQEAVDDARQDQLGRLVEEVLGIGDDAENGRHLFEHGFEQGLLVFEVPVDQGGRLEAGAFGDAFDAGATEAALGHDVEGGVEDLGATAAVLRAAQRAA